MSTRDVSGGKGGRCVRLTTYHHIVPMSRNLGALTLLDPSRPAWPVMGVPYLYLLLSLQSSLFYSEFPTKIVCALLAHQCNMARTPHHYGLGHQNIWQEIQKMDLQL
jgi:hypothetical protein